MVRSKIVWAKPNPMPTSVRDRLSTTWEPLYLLTRDRHYFFDLDAIRVPARSALSRPTRLGRHTKYATRPGSRPGWSVPLAGNNSGLDRMKEGGRLSHPLGKNPGDVWTIPTAAYPRRTLRHLPRSTRRTTPARHLPRTNLSDLRHTMAASPDGQDNRIGGRTRGTAEVLRL